MVWRLVPPTAIPCGKLEWMCCLHTVEKAAEILVKVMSMAPRKLNTIQPQDFRDLAVAFNIELDEKYLYEKKSDIIGER